ncbi:uncharacterized protein MPTK2_1g12470 [Marchantia polymorpha subsp. ruderalis]
MQSATISFPQVCRVPDLQTWARCPQRIRNSPVSDCRSRRVSWINVERDASWTGMTSPFRRNWQQISQPEQKQTGQENPRGDGLEFSDGVYHQPSSVSRSCPSFAHARRRCSRSTVKSRICAERSSRSKFCGPQSLHSVSGYSCRKKGADVAGACTQRQRWSGDLQRSSFEIQNHPLSRTQRSTKGRALQTRVSTSGGEASTCEVKPARRVSIHQKRSLQHLCGCCSSSDDHNETKSPDAAVIVEEESVDNVGVQVALAVLRFYKRELSPYIPASCRYVPTCSEYAQQAYRKYGFAKGSVLTAWRLARCNPLGSSGFDPPRWFGEEKPPQV